MQNNKDKNRGTKIQYSDVLYIGLCLCVITRSALTLPTRFVFLLIKEQREKCFSTPHSIQNNCYKWVSDPIRIILVDI